MTATGSARRLWNAVETVHAVTYFHPASLAAIAATGVKGFWMGYFAARLAPLGPIGAATATAVCCNFSPVRTRRALPDAWTIASPAALLSARSEGAVAALRDCGIYDADATAAADLLEPIVAGLDPCGRPLGAANLEVAAGGGDLARLWQLCTVLREHRGDGHVALIVGADLSGREINALVTARHGLDPAILRGTRGWTEAEWSTAIEGLRRRGLIEAGGTLTDAGRALHSGIERRTDELALASYGDHDLDAGIDALTPLARRVVEAEVLPFPNPMGLGRD